jgi:Cof subfamily protein (haloacid dehalogenase superfamily)
MRSMGHGTPGVAGLPCYNAGAMSIRLLALDLDGTLLDSDAKISSANRQALEEAAARGVEIVVVTGRRFQSAQQILAELPFPVTLISSNGAAIVTATGEIVRRNYLARAVAREVLESAGSFRPYAVAIFERPGRGQVVMQEDAAPEGPLGWYVARYPDKLLQVPYLPDALSEDPVQIMFGGPPAFLAPLETLLGHSPAAEKIHITWTKYFARNIALLDVLARGCTKGSALAYLSGCLGIEPRQVMAIGDNDNDLEMLRFSGLPVVMGNGTPGLDEQGWPVTLSNDQNGVAVALRRYLAGDGRSA